MSYLQKLFGEDLPAVPEVSVAQVRDGLDEAASLMLVDVREPWEWAQGHLDGAVHMPLNTLPARLHELDRDKDIVVYCHLGQRSWYAVAYLRQQGFTRVASLSGGIEAWDRWRP